MYMFMKLFLLLETLALLWTGKPVKTDVAVIEDGKQTKAVNAVERSIFDYLQADEGKLLEESKIVAFDLGLCWEDGYHRFRTADPELVEKLRQKVLSLKLKPDTASTKYACDAGIELNFLMENGHFISFYLDDWRLEVLVEDGYLLYDLANDDGLWELCQLVYQSGEQVPIP